MNFKIFAALFLTLLAVQVSIQTPLKDENIKNFVLANYDKTLQRIQESIDLVSDLLVYVQSEEDNIKNEIVSFAVTQAKLLNSLALEVVDQLRQNATEDGKAVLDCIEAEENRTDVAIEKIATIAGNCVAAAVDLGFPEAKIILGQFSQMHDDIKDEVETLRACSDNEFVCLLHFYQVRLPTTGNFIQQMKDDVKQIIELVKTMISDISNCEILPEIATNVQDIFNDAVVCIKAK